MLTGLFNWLYDALSGGFLIALCASFLWGVTSILLSPCHLSSIPLIIGFIDIQGKISIKRAFWLSLVFASGILTTILVIGLITASMGRLMGDLGSVGNYAVAIVFFIVGLHLLGIIPAPFSGATGIKITQKGLWAALILGLIFGIGVGPCTFAFMAPVLGVVFRVGSAQLFFAVLLLIFYGFGHCLLIVFAGTLTGKVQRYLNWSERTRGISLLRKICGILVLLGGVYLLIK